MSKHTPGPWSVELYGEPDYPSFVIHNNPDNRICFMATPGSNDDPEMIEANARLIACAPDLLVVAKNAAATIAAIYEWLDRVEKAGGATSISGVAACHAMLTSLRKNAGRTETLIMEPLRAAIAKSTTEAAS